MYLIKNRKREKKGKTDVNKKKSKKNVQLETTKAKKAKNK